MPLRDPEPLKPLLTVRKAAIVWFLSALVAAVLARIFLEPMGEVNEARCWAWVSGYILGHILMAIMITRRRLLLRLPVDKSWLDLFVILYAPWGGPIIWYLEWRKRQSRLK